MTNPAVFFIPHQDDEILSMGPYILQHVLAARDVQVVLCSDGQNSGARATIESQKGIELSVSAFSKARDREFVDALSRLGVPKENIHFENVEDGAFTRPVIKAIMRKYIAGYGVGSYKTMSWMDKHIDHFVLGRSLDELNRGGEVPNGDARFCRSLSYPTAPTPGGSWQRSDAAILTNAANAYNVWLPDEPLSANDLNSGPRYAIGFTSVKSSFDTLLADPKSWVHGDSSGYSTSGRADANAWLSSNGMTAYL